MSIVKRKDDLLIRDYIEGDDNALEILINRHKSRIYGFIYSKIPDKAICNDIFQDTFIKVIKTLKSGSYSEQGKFLPWIIRISNNLIMDHFRMLKNKSLLHKSIDDDFFGTILDESLSIENELIFNQIQEDLNKILKELPPEQEEVVILSIYNNMTHKEIAELKKISINTSLGRMRYAIKNLRKIIERNRISLTH